MHFHKQVDWPSRYTCLGNADGCYASRSKLYTYIYISTELGGSYMHDDSVKRWSWCHFIRPRVRSILRQIIRNAPKLADTENKRATIFKTECSEDITFQLQCCSKVFGHSKCNASLKWKLNNFNENILCIDLFCHV